MREGKSIIAVPACLRVSHAIGVRQLAEWHGRHGAMDVSKVVRDKATRTTRTKSNGEKIVFRGSGFYAGRSAK